MDGFLVGFGRGEESDVEVLILKLGLFEEFVVDGVGVFVELSSTGFEGFLEIDYFFDIVETFLNVFAFLSKFDRGCQYQTFILVFELLFLVVALSLIHI